MIREPVRLIVGQSYSWFLNARGRVYSKTFEGECDIGQPSIRPVEHDVSPAYDAESTEWALNVLLRHDLRACFPIEDPEAPHDVVRMRGVLPALAQVFAATRCAAVGERIEFLLKGTVRQIDSDSRVGWDATNAALRLLSLLTAAETLGPCGLSLPAVAGLLRGFVVAHGPVLNVGRFSEPEGNHQLVNVVGRAALHLLLCPELPLSLALADELTLTLNQQLLPDGGHVERSPHYHAESVAIASLITNVDMRRRGALARRIAPTLAHAKGALAVMVSPAGTPVRFSDISRTFSGKNASCEIGEMLNAAESGGTEGQLPDFGLVQSRWVGCNDRFALAFDCGPMGMEGNPGHGHSDMLSFCFWVNEHELICDPGTFLYADQPEAMDFKLRGAHNCIDWPTHPSAALSRYFRWRRIPPPPMLGGRTVPPGELCLSAEHRWRVGLRRYRHRRTWIPLTTGVGVLDQVQSSSRESAAARLNFHPDSRSSFSGPNVAHLVYRGGTATISVFGVDACRMNEAWYAPTYGVRRRAPSLRSTFTTGPGPSTIFTVIEVP
jgi:hypothetical protein